MATDPKLLDGSVDDVTARLAGLDADDLASLSVAETAGKNRKGVLQALEAALAAAAVVLAPHDPADAVDPFLADQQDSVSEVSHPAVDGDPRAHTTAEQNRIDFNDPRLSGPESVTKNLEAPEPDAAE